MSDDAAQNTRSGPRWRRRLLVTVCLLLALPVVALLTLLHSEWAARYALGKATGLVDGLTIEQVAGTLAGTLTLSNVGVINSELETRIQRVRLSAQPGALMRGELVVRELGMEGVRLTPNAPTSATPPTPLTVPELAAPLPITVQSLTVTDAVWTPLADFPLERLSATLAWRGTAVTIDSLNAAAPGGGLSGSATVDTRGDVPLTAAINWQYPEQTLRGKLTATGSLKRLKLVHDLDGQFEVRSEGTVELLDRLQPQIQLRHTCSLPCVINDITLTDPVLAHSGTLDNSSITLNTGLAAGPLQSTSVEGTLQYVDGQLNIESVNATDALLEASLSGTVSPAASPLFDVDVKIARVDAQLLNADTQGNIAAQLKLTGSDAQNLSAVIEQLTGTINGYTLSGSGNLRRRGETLEVERVAFVLGDNKIELDGTATRAALALNVNVLLPQLDQIDARLSGAVTAQATVRGTAQSPEIDTSGQVRQFGFQNTSLDSAEFELVIDKQRRVDGTLRAQAIKQGTFDADNLAIKLGGALDAIDVAAELHSKTLSANLTARVAAATDATLINIERAVIDARELGTWSISEPFAIRSQSQQFEIGAHRWHSEAAYATVEEVRQVGDAMTLRAEISELPLELAAGFLPPDVGVAGRVKAVLDLTRRGGLWQGNVNWQQTDTVFKLRSATGSRRLALPVVSLQVEQSANLATTTVAIEGDFGLNVNGKVVMHNPELLQGAPIDGQLDANMQDVSWLTPWLGDVSNLAGGLRASLGFAGTAAEPRVTGKISFADGALTYDAAGLQLEKLQFTAEADNDSAVTVAGTADSGGGSLRFEGSLDQPWSDQRALTLNVSGNDVQAFNAADYQLWLSPELVVKATASGANVTGSVRVPRADIRVRELPPNVVRPSADIVVSGREVSNPFALPFDGDIAVTLGDEVHVFALGLDADVGGDLRVRLNADQPPRLDGRIFLEQGRYAAYGQKLDIERGNLIYAGPIDNPTLDIRAARTISAAGSDITAGVMVGGTATAPTVSIFTDPTTSQTDALSYLLLGRAASDTSGAESAALSQTALAIGMSRSSPLTNRLATGLGLDELSVGGDSVDAAELVAGKQINERLYIRYRYGVFSNLGAILLRYRLSRRLALEAGSSDAQSIDVLYTIEK